MLEVCNAVKGGSIGLPGDYLHRLRVRKIHVSRCRFLFSRTLMLHFHCFNLDDIVTLGFIGIVFILSFLWWKRDFFDEPLTYIVSYISRPIWNPAGSWPLVEATLFDKEDFLDYPSAPATPDSQHRGGVHSSIARWPSPTVHS